MNRLAGTTSPYLLQHSENPVDWFPWGAEALAKAKAEDKPILLSIGYAACHWCHVMERESFENEAIARQMNDGFISIKVDREERPDLDAIYMAAVMRLTGHGGWPLTAFLTPEGVPFYAGTYYPPEPRHGMPSFPQVLSAVRDAWDTNREGVTEQAASVAKLVDETLTASVRPDWSAERDDLSATAKAILEQHDAEWGGFGSAPKFPQPMIGEFLLRMSLRDEPGALGAVTTTLDRMARGGIFDHVGGGFARYSTDRLWLVPHFEKMLYDNAQLLRLYARAFQVTGSELYRETALRTAGYLMDELRHPDGGFYSSQDADTEGVEGRYYVWPFEELIALAGDDMPLAIAAFASAGDGNFEGTNVIWRPEPDEEVAGRVGVTVEELRAAIDRVLARLREARTQRVAPATDDKVLAAWNGLAIGALAEAGRIFERPELISAAERAATFVLTEMRPGGRLQRSWREGRCSGPGYLDDHAMMAEACLTLYETNFDRNWFERAVELMDGVVDLFLTDGVLYDTGTDAEALIVRPRDLYDNAVPSGTSVTADVWLRLAAHTGDSTYERLAGVVLGQIGPLALRAPLGFGTALCALDRWMAPRTELAVVGEGAGAEELIRAARTRYLPDLAMASGAPGDPHPLLEGRNLVDGRAAAYVCERFACKAPVTDAEELGRLLV